MTRPPASDPPAAAEWLSGGGLTGAGLSGRLIDPGPWRAIWHRFRRDRGSVTALAVVLVIVGLSAAAPLIAPYGPDMLLDMVALKSQPPSLAHPFGTDSVSRDVLSRVLFGGRVSLVVSVMAMLTATTVGTLYGAIAGYAGGAIDEVMMRMTDACLSIPRVLLLLTICALWGHLSLLALVLVLGFTGWFGISRLVRAEVMALRTREWALAARSIGASGSRVLWRHLVPNLLSPVIVVTTLGIANVILLEAGLSYLGVGVQPPRASWGNIMQEGADQVRALWWLSVFPGIAIATTVIAINAVGDGLRAAADPRDRSPGAHG